VIVNVDGPVGVDAAVVTANVDDPVAGFGVKVPVAPVGRPVTLSVTLPLNPPDGVSVML
jgi:hypothetical protein